MVKTLFANKPEPEGGTRFGTGLLRVSPVMMRQWRVKETLYCAEGAHDDRHN